MIIAFFNAWGKLPWRKPVAMSLAMVDLFVILKSSITGIDITANTCTFLIWVNGTIMGLAYGTSTVESIKRSEVAQNIVIEGMPERASDCLTEGEGVIDGNKADEERNDQ